MVCGVGIWEETHSITRHEAPVERMSQFLRQRTHRDSAYVKLRFRWLPRVELPLFLFEPILDPLLVGLERVLGQLIGKEEVDLIGFVGSLLSAANQFTGVDEDQFVLGLLEIDPRFRDDTDVVAGFLFRFTNYRILRSFAGFNGPTRKVPVVHIRSVTKHDAVLACRNDREGSYGKLHFCIPFVHWFLISRNQGLRL